MKRNSLRIGEICVRLWSVRCGFGGIGWEDWRCVKERRWVGVSDLVPKGCESD